jgi:hypothetical protein
VLAIDLTGCRFGQLVVVSENRRDPKDGLWWDCRCDCGNLTTVRGSSLRARATKTCGCGKSFNRIRPYEAIYRRLVRDAERLRGIAVDLTYEEFVEFTNQTECFYCTRPVVWKDFSSGGYGYNLDRKANAGTYTKDNLVVCCKRCNMGKRDTFTFEEWYAMTRCFREAR